MAANLQAMGKEDEAFALTSQIASANVPGFNAPMALIEQVHILQEKGKTEDARRICETIADAISRQLRSHGSEPVAANVFEDGETGNTAGCRASENGRFGHRHGSTNHENNASRATCAEWCAISSSETIGRAGNTRRSYFSKKWRRFSIAVLLDRRGRAGLAFEKPLLRLALGEVEAFTGSRLP